MADGRSGGVFPTQERMPLTPKEIIEIRSENFADDMDVLPAMSSWTRDRVTAYFESAGQSEEVKPTGGSSATPAPVAPSPAWSLSAPGSIGTRLAAPMTLEVVHSIVKVRKSPEMTADELGMLRKGTLISVTTVHDEWVQLEHSDDSLLFASGASKPPTERGLSDPARYGEGNCLDLLWPPCSCNHTDGAPAPVLSGGGWMLTNGAALKLGTLLRPHIIEVSPQASMRPDHVTAWP